MKILERPPVLAAPAASPAAAATAGLADRFVLEENAEAEPGESFAEAVASGLRAEPKTLPCRFFYDERGSLLFEQITRLEEYYPTRVERQILVENASEIARAAGPDPELIELGSGSASKTRLLIRALIAKNGSLMFRPIDISPTILESSSRALLDEHPELTIQAHAAEYDAGLLGIAQTRSQRTRLVAWLGSSIGNLSREEAAAFLHRVQQNLDAGDRILIGIDRRKDAQTLERAYDDERGVTAEFNLNLLERANRELGADFDTTQFEHRAVWRDEIGRIEMHLVSRCRQRVRIQRASYDFAPGETIHTENSYKYSRQEIDELAERAGLCLEQRWSDAQDRFELSLFRPDRS